MEKGVGAILVWIAIAIPACTGAQIPYKDSSPVTSIEDVHIECNSNEITVAIKTNSRAFNGMVYPRGLSKNSSCMMEFLQQPSPVRYKLPLRSCNTMSTELGDGGIEYFNTIVVQPHLKLVTNQGRGFHIRCRYQAKDKTITNNMNVSMIDATPISAIAPMPGCTMKIFYGDPSLKEVAENVKIGDPLTLVISIDKQDMYGIKVSDCLVRDGLGWGEQRLINSEGCPIDGEIMGQFLYSDDKTIASVHFQAHKFPYTASVYYQCNVRLCIKAGNGCEELPPSCSNDGKRRRRAASGKDAKNGTPATIEVYSGLYANEATDINKADGSDDVSRTRVSELHGTPATIEVYSGLYVNEATDINKADGSDDVSRTRTEGDSSSICISQRNFAIGIAVAGLVLMLAVIAAILILLARRRSKKEASTTGSSIYSGPYTNTAYSHSS